jgi:hypothetical protein
MDNASSRHQFLKVYPVGTLSITQEGHTSPPKYVEGQKKKHPL